MFPIERFLKSVPELALFQKQLKFNNSVSGEHEQHIWPISGPDPASRPNHSLRGHSSCITSALPNLYSWSNYRQVYSAPSP